jgi:cysteinyl-tRNA synthetase
VLGVGDILTRDLVEAPAASVDPAIVARVAQLIEERNAARRARDFALADRLRDVLSAEGIVLTDGKDGTTWTVAGG